MSYPGAGYSRVRPTRVWHTLKYATTKEECTIEFKSCLESVAAPTPAPIVLQKTLYVTINSLNEASPSNSSLAVVESPQKQVYKGSTFVFRYSGGTLLDVNGHSLSSVDKPIIQLTVVIYRTHENGSTLTISTKTTLRVGDKFTENNLAGVIWDILQPR